MKPERRQRTVEETIAIAALGCVTFPAASWDKRFARMLFSADGITEKEVPQLWRLFKRYRRQIDCPRKDELLAMADKLAAPDFRAQQAAARALEREQEKLAQYKAAMGTTIKS